MGFKDLNLKIHYDSEDDNLIEDFYNPILSNSKEYYRIAGFFNSTSLSMAARGMKDFIKNNGKMKLLCGAKLDPDEVKSIMLGEIKAESIISSNFLKDLDNLENEIRFNHVQILGWMIANDLLEIKIVISIDPKIKLFHKKGIMHYKVGINRDFNNNYISFSGSINETGSGWNDNLEQFNVYKSWDNEQNKYLQKDIDLFTRTWDGNSDRYEVINVPTAVKRKLIDISPKEFHELKFEEKNTNIPIKKPKLFNNQIKACDLWFKNNKKGIFSMATGTGKTFTSLGCLDRLLDQEDKLVTIICVPYKHLIQQWKKSIKDFKIDTKVDKIIIVDSSNHNGKIDMKKAILKINNDYLNKIIILTTPQSMSQHSFIQIIKDTYFNTHYFLIGDEMHELGSYKFQQGLLEEYDYRLGLSATPERKYDDFGTDILFNYFGDIVYCFSLDEAINTTNPMTHISYLTPYKYHPNFISLTNDEIKEYQYLTKNLIIESNKKNKNQSKIENLMFKRANVIKNAKNKYKLLDEILNQLGSEVNNLIIYCSDKQIKKVLDMVGNKHDLTIKKFTNEESADPEKKYGGLSYRDFILKNFEKKEYQCLVAMHCLDEGVDVPSASKAILLCNSTNPREFIQRLGRILRRYPDKNIADVFDFLVKPEDNNNPQFKSTENEIYTKELERCDEIGKLAVNSTEVYLKIYN